MTTKDEFVQIGLLIDGREFIPLSIVHSHMPFAAPPEVIIDPVFARVCSCDFDSSYTGNRCDWCGGFDPTTIFDPYTKQGREVSK